MKALDTLAALKAIGFSDKEARTYLASLALGPATVADIAARAKLTRPSVYLMIEALERRGMMTMYKQGKKSVYRASSPLALRYINAQAKASLAKREQALNSMIDSFKSISSNSSDIVIKVIGVDEATAMIQNGSLTTKIPTIEILNLERVRQSIPPQFDGDKRLAIIKLKNYKSIVQENLGYTKNPGTTTRTSKCGREIKGMIELVDNNLYLDYLLDGSKIIHVENSVLATTIRTMFEAIHDESIQ
jgi:sugar-specific transcriptional regulator TrmB